VAFRIFKLGGQTFELVLELRLCLGLVNHRRLLHLCKAFLDFGLSPHRGVKLLLKLAYPTLSLCLPQAHLPLNLSLIFDPLTLLAAHHDLEGLDLPAEPPDLVSLGSEDSLLGALSVLLLLLEVEDAGLEDVQLGSDLVELPSREVQVFPPQGGEVVPP
jgi:hypothetical protein